MTNNLPFVSIVIPCRNEEKLIKNCLDSIIANDYPKEKMEVFIIDGMSEDKTRGIVKNYSEQYSFINILENPKKITPCAFNIGIKNAKGEIIMFGGAHAVYEKEYISKCVRYLKEYNADCVGGVLKTVPFEKTVIANAIAICLSSFFGAASSFRIGAKNIKEVDTVFGGCYKKEVFQKIGLFNENLKRSQDMEFNLRLKRKGGKIILVPGIITYYYSRGNLREFLINNLENGFWAVYSFKFTKSFLSLRHYIPLLFIGALILLTALSFFSGFFSVATLILLLVYFVFIVYFSFRVVVKEKDFRYFLILPIVFLIRQLGYGLGSLWGLIRVMS